jgi:outer membrane protein assembly factor BamB
MKRSLLLAVIAVTVTATSWTALGDNWPRFRGPNGTGASSTTTIPTKISSESYNWKVKLPGSGHGSPVIWGNKVFLLCTNKSAGLIVTCLDATSGKLLWTKSAPYTSHRQHRDNSFATCTPAVDSERVYVNWATPDQVTLAALTHDGKVAWTRSNLGEFKSQHGGGTSPMIYKDMVILTNDQLGDSYLLAVDAATGKTRWQLKRNGGVKTAYAVPCIYTGSDGKDQLICMSTTSGVSGHDPMTGKQLWAIGDAFPIRVVSSPVLAGGLVFGSCGQGGGGTRFVGVKPGQFDGSGAKLVHDLKVRMPYVPTAVEHNGLLFVLADSGIVSCVDPATGKTIWGKKRIDSDGNPSFYGSPVVVNGHIYAIDKSGTVYVYKAAKKFELVSKHALGEKSFATPAVADGRMYLRTTNHLICIGGKK